METTDQTSKENMELFPGNGDFDSFSSAKTPTGHAVFSASQAFPSLAQETITDGQSIYTWSLNFESMDSTASSYAIPSWIRAKNPSYKKKFSQPATDIRARPGASGFEQQKLAYASYSYFRCDLGLGLA